MAEVVLVHGIGQQQGSADTLERDWVPELAGGVRTAGSPDLADRLWRDTRSPGGISTRMAFYGDLFLTAGRMGTDEEDLTAEQRQLAEQLAGEWLARTATRASRPADREVAELELAYLSGPIGQEQGIRALFRSALAGAARIPWFARAGLNAAQLVNRSLTQVTRYLTDGDLRARAIARVADHVDETTRMIIGHSLGSVVAYEAIHQHSWKLPLLVTLGSPLGLRTVVYDRTRPQPPAYPATVRRWVNIADPDDIIAAAPDLNTMFGSALPTGCCFDGGYTVDNGAKPHTASFYLTKTITGLAVAEALNAPPGLPLSVRIW